MRLNATYFLRNFYVLTILLILVATLADAQTLYSRKSGNWDDSSLGNATWSLTGHGGASCACSPGILNTVVIGSGHTVTYRSATPANTQIVGLEINDNGLGGTLNFGNNGGATTLTVTGDVTINAGGTFTGVGATNAHNLVVRGNLRNDGVLNEGATHTLTFNGAADRTLSGSGTFTLNNVTMNTTLNADVNIDVSVPINGILTFSANGKMIVNAGANITLGSAASITGASVTRYIELDGGTGSNGQLIKTSNGNVTSWRIIYPIGTATGGYTPLDLSAATITTNPTNNARIAVKPIYNVSVPGQLRRQFRIFVSGNTAATTLTNGTFNYNISTDVSSGDVIANYSTLWYLSAASGTWINVTGTAPGSGAFISPGTAQSLGNGTYFYAIGNSTAFINTWYSYQNGVWSDPDIWTLDPSGTSLLNPLNQAPLIGDQVVILNGFIVTSDINGIVLSQTTIQGGATLDMVATTGHTIGNVLGSGLLRVNGTGLPAGTYTSFVASTGGTIEYYDIGGTLPVTQTTYNNLLLTNSTNSAVNFLQLGNLTVNNEFNITQNSGSGTVTWQINDATNAQRTINLLGNLTVSANGRVRVGTGNEASTAPHILNMTGNIINDGSIKFYDDADTEFSQAEYTAQSLFTNELQGNAVTVTFNKVTNQTVTCNGVTDFYRLVTNKGNGQQSMLTVTSSNTANFRLFGPCNLDLSGAAPNYTSDNALSLVNGTLQLAGSINIPCLVLNGGGGIGGGWPIPQNAALWMNSPDITIQVTNTTDTGDNGRQLYVFGQLRVSEGTLNLGYSRGLLGGGSGVFLLEGGTVNTNQFRTTYLGSNNRFSYTQTGGTMNVGTTGNNGVEVNTYPRFALPYTECSFSMSGGDLNIARPMASGTSANGGILIFAAESNINVTGGTVNLILPASNVNFNICSTAKFYNLDVRKTGGGGTSIAILNGITFNDGSSFARPVQPLTVDGNLRLISNNNPTLDCNNQNLTLGGNASIQTGTTLTPGTNTILINGSGPQSFTHTGTITSLNNVVMTKSNNSVLTLGGSSTFPNITGALTLNSGTLADGGRTLTATGTITNNATHSGAGAIVVNGPTTIGGNGGTFGNLTIQTNGTVTTQGAQTVTGTLRLNGTTSTILAIGPHNLSALGAIATTGTLGSNYFIQTNGLQNAGGLTRQSSASVLLYPVGSGTEYTPITTVINATTHGRITVRPVSGEHPMVTTSNRSLLYYWRVTSTGFAGVTSVSHRLYTYGGATANGTTTAYQAARFDPGTFTWSVTGSLFNAGATTVIPNFSFGLNIDGEYTAGDNSSPFGTVRVFYSRQNGAWNSNTTWSNSPCTGAGACGVAVPAGATAGTNFPGLNNPVIVGDLNNNHTVTIDANGRNCGNLTVSVNSILDCAAFTSLNFGASSDGSVLGNGTIRISTTGSPAAFPAGDFTSFLGPNGGTVEWYGNTKTIPTTGPAPQNMNLSNYYNLVLNPASGQTITMPATGLTIYNNLTKSGAGTVTNDNVARTHNIGGNLSVTAGTMTLANSTAATSVAINLTGNLSVSNGATFGVPGGAASGSATNLITISGGITNNGTLRFLNGNATRLLFTGTNDVNFDGTGSGGTILSLVTVDKGTSQTPTVNFTTGGTVTAATSGWLSLLDGTFNFNTGGTFTISSANAAYTIPSTAKLKAESGTVNVLTGNGAADLLLNGALEVAGATVNIGPAGGTTDNDIEYAAAGSPSIIVSAGTLNVNGAIRRPVLTLAGALVYNQSGGNVLVDGRNPNNTRGIFEIENNAGSSFTFSGGTLTIERPTNGTGSYADLYLNAATNAVSPASQINIGVATGNQAFKINVVPVIGSLALIGTANTKTTQLVSSDLNVGGTLSIASNATLNTNALNVFIGGNLTGTGVYNGAANTTTFNGSGAQSAALTATSQFLNMTVDKSAGTVTLSGASPTITNLNILNGVLNVGNLNLTVQGDVVNNSSQIGTGAVLLAGGPTVTTQTITSSGGSFTNLNLTGTAVSKTVMVNGNMAINGTLNFATTDRYLNIGSNLLTFGTSASISGASSSAFIKTNGASSDLGVIKNWPTGTNSFTYAVGTRTNYTPVTFTSLNVSSAGDLNVIPVDDKHPTANTGSTENILNYYWIVTRGSTLAYAISGTHTYGFPTALLGGSGGTLSAGYLDIQSSTPGWQTSTNPAVSPGGTATTTLMTYTNFLNVNLPIAGETFHYAVGTVNTLPNPIIPVYSRRSDANVNNLNVGGDWNDINSWTLTPGGFGPVWGSIPYGNSVVIVAGSRINITQSGKISFITRIDGTLSMPSNKVGHNMGILRGTGTLRTPITTLPAGNYTSFVSSAGGTIEYIAPMTMNNRSLYNNISIIGTGSVIMTNTDLTLNGSVTINAGATLNNNTNDRNITMAGSWTTAAGGTFAPGTGTVTFNGSNPVTINGTNAFNNVTISKTGGSTVSLAGSGTTTVTNNFTMNTGHLVTTAAHLLVIPVNATLNGGSVNSYISGPVTKGLVSGGSQYFPLGSVAANLFRPATIANTSAADTWQMEYVGANPNTGGYNPNVFNNANLQKVSMFEYWNMSRTGATSADVTITYGVGSYIPPDIGNTNNLRVVRWDGTKWDLPPGASSYATIGNNISGTVTVTNVTNFSPFTFGSLDSNSPLPVKWGPFEGKRRDDGVALRWIVLQQIDNDRFVVERSEDGGVFTAIATLPGQGTTSEKLEYTYLDTEASTLSHYYYRIRQVDFDGTSDFSKAIVVSPVGTLTKFWVAYPNPVKERDTFTVGRAGDQSTAEDVNVSLYSPTGILVFKGSGTLEEVNGRIDAVLHEAKPGMYLLQISNGLIQENFRVIRH